jgi:hypothetical protein
MLQRPFRFLTCLSVMMLTIAPLMHGKVLPILDESYGYRLLETAECDFWWCEATYKVGQARALPTASAEGVEIDCARNEYEPFQVVLRPRALMKDLQISVSDFVNTRGEESILLGSTNVQICSVEYVPVTITTDGVYGSTGPHPDPLVPLTELVSLSPGTNYPFWFTIYVPKETPPGVYEGQITIHTEDAVHIPVKLNVFNFALPETTHTRTAYYVDISETWHKPANLAQRREIWDLYMDNFRKHRVAPYSAHLLSPITWTLTNATSGEFRIDFSNFDAAMNRYVDDFGFNSFNLFGHKSPPFPSSLGGYGAFSPQWRQLFAQLMKPILTHLRERSWLDEAYCYWIDEPQPAGFPNMLSGMNALMEGAPGLKRILTFNYYPAPEWDIALDGNVDIWVPILDAQQAKKPRFQRRLYAGEENWWYVCMGPSGPYLNNFVDHPAINHRLRFWLAQKDRITGDLYWSVNYWGGKNPWTNAYTFGNGDGVLLYPPTRTLPSGPVIAGPVDSIRWELTREGLEDGEYFWLLKHLLQKAQGELGVEHPAVVEGYAALAGAYGLVPSAKGDCQDPRQLYSSRLRIASAIERLQDGTPWFVAVPQPRCVREGEDVLLKADVIGWPLPMVQWLHNGTLLTGATDSKLRLTGATSEQSGDYTVIASNNLGTVSANTRLRVLSNAGAVAAAPEILVQPESATRQPGDNQILSVVAVSEAAITYQWFQDNSPLVHQTNAVLALTNLQTQHVGEYFVSASNITGVTASQTARVDFVIPPSLALDFAGVEHKQPILRYSSIYPAQVLVSSNAINWNLWFEPLPLIGETVLLDDSAVQPQRFYRVLSRP